MQGTAIIIGNMIGGTTAGGGGVIAPTFFIIGDGTIDGDNIIDESGNFLVSQLAPVVFTGLLDTSYGSGAESAYSVRKLRTAYTGAAMQVQATSGGATAEIGFDVNNNLDTATLLAFAGTNEVGVSIWYDQSLNGKNATQSSVSNRPIVVAAGGALVTDNGKAALNLINDGFDISLTTLTELGYFGVNNFTYSAATGYFGDIGNNKFTAYTGSKYRIRGLIADMTGPVEANSRNIITLLSTTANGSAAYQSGTQSASGGNASGTTAAVSIYEIGGGQWLAQGKSQEFILYNTDKTTDRTSIEENIGDYFTQNTPLLDTYTGAAAAYSLRLLRTAYTGFAIKVQDNVGGATQDIGFNVFGELDTVSLSAYGGVNDVFVETWYDQSGSGNNAVQATSSARPKIYDGTTGVIVENGKPAVDFDGSNDFFGDISKPSSTPAETMAIVLRLDVTTDQRMVGHPTPTQATGSIRFFVTSGNFAYNDYEANPTASTRALSAADTNQNLIFGEVDDTAKTAHIYKNGVAGTDGATLTKPLQLLGYSETDIKLGSNRTATSSFFNGKMQEYIRWDIDREGNRTGIETNINDFYSIY